MRQLLLLLSCASAFVPPGRSNTIGRVAPPHAVDASVLHAVDASVLSDSTLALASFQDFRDGIADVVRPFAILAAVPAFGIALIPVTLAAALARAAAAPSAGACGLRGARASTGSSPASRVRAANAGSLTALPSRDTVRALPYPSY